jgi:hypothetical protein
MGGAERGMSLYQALQDAAMKKKQNELAMDWDSPVDIPGIGTVPKSKAAEYKLKMMEIMRKPGGTGAPAGLRLKPGEVWDEVTQSIIALPGGDLYKNQKNKFSQDLANMKAIEDRSTDTENKIGDLLKAPGFESQFGGYNAYLTKHLPWGGAQDAGVKVDSLKSGLMAAGKQMMASGGAIGQITEREWPILEGMIARISPTMSEDEARNTLEGIKAKMEGIKRRAQEAYQSEWGGSQFEREQGMKPLLPPALSGITNQNNDLSAADKILSNPSAYPADMVAEAKLLKGIK